LVWKGHPASKISRTSSAAAAAAAVVNGNSQGVSWETVIKQQLIRECVLLLGACDSAILVVLYALLHLLHYVYVSLSLCRRLTFMLFLKYATIAECWCI